MRKTDVYIFRDLTCILWFRLAFYAAVWYLIDILGGFPLIKVCDYNGKEKTSLGRPEGRCAAARSGRYALYYAATTRPISEKRSTSPI